MHAILYPLPSPLVPPSRQLGRLDDDIRSGVTHISKLIDVQSVEHCPATDVYCIRGPYFVSDQWNRLFLKWDITQFQVSKKRGAEKVCEIVSRTNDTPPFHATV
jgi:hypothetical protein